jgi:hypothetical protein
VPTWWLSRVYRIFDESGGVNSSVSEQTLWLTSTAQGANLMCADPSTGAVRASESPTVPLSGVVASGQHLYASTDSGEVVICNTVIGLLRMKRLLPLLVGDGPNDRLPPKEVISAK